MEIMEIILAVLVSLMPIQSELVEIVEIQEDIVIIEEAVETKEIIEDYKYQEIIEKESLKYGIPTEIIRGIITVESNWNPNLDNTGLNKNGSVDFGLMQINNRYTNSWLEDMNWQGEWIWSSPEHNIKLGCYIISRYKNYWDDKVDESVLWDYVLSSYNKGGSGTEKYGLGIKYINKVKTSMEGLK